MPHSDRHTTHQFGTFAGVFTPSILTIFGLIMFMRCNFVVGQAGILHSLAILILCIGITLLTALSLAAISTNTPVAGGGAYFLISRVLGPGFGSAIGIALFLAQALSVPFYILGFVEALITSFPALKEFFLPLCLLTLVILFGVAWIGAEWALKLQFVVLAVLCIGILSFMIGAWMRFSSEQMWVNWQPQYQQGNDIWDMFAIYFPAVTGIMAGVSMSGDLKDPARSIPRGTLLAVLVSFVVYGLQIVICGGMASAEALRQDPFKILVTNAVAGTGYLVIASVFCATLSSAIGSKLGAPRVLQALGRDGALPGLGLFARGTAHGDEPRRALVATLIIGAIILVLVGDSSEGTGLNLLAGIVSMVFLYTYGMTNLAAFVESFGGNPSFRPRFHLFHWTTALAGMMACVWAAVMINTAVAVLALALLVILFLLARRQVLTEGYGDARRGFVYQRLRNNMLMLERMPAHPKNWRPTILVFSGNPRARLSLVTYAGWLGMNCGIISVVEVLVGELRDISADQQEEARERLAQFVTENHLDVFPETVVMSNFDRDLSLFLQSFSIGPIKPNIVLFGWVHEPDRVQPYFQHLRTVERLGKNIVIVIDRGLLVVNDRRRIDCWWRGQRNGSLIFILAHLIQQNEDWHGVQLRVLRQVRHANEVAGAQEELEQICEAARIDAEIKIPVSEEPYAKVLRQESEDATLILMGFIAPSSTSELAFHESTIENLRDMPSTILVSSAGEADLLA
tara:strand:- start:25 stop:2247 length:2223 start_codon:yes stop_codon:yes gene_type:complete